MDKIDKPVPSNSDLLKTILTAFLIALVISIFVVLPAEFGIDPTGVGSRLGLDKISVEENERETIVRAGEGGLEFRQDEVDIVIPANNGLEYKFFLNTHSNITYEWSSTSPLYFDMHGEPDGDTSGYFESYGASTTDDIRGSITVPFAGSHGWYWRNDTAEIINVHLKTLGNYRVIGLL